MQGNFGTRATRRRFLGSIIGVSGVAAAGALLAACGGAAPEPTAAPKAAAPAAGGATPQAAAKPAAAATGKIIVWQPDLFTKSANELAKQQVTDYATQKGWQIDVSLNPTDVMAKLMAGLESGDVPDLYQSSTELPALYGSDALIDVSSVVSELAGTNGAPVKLAERGGNFKGKWWGVPWFMYADAFFVRKDVLDKANVKIEDYKTFDQRRDLALQVSDPAKPLWGWGMTPKAATGDGDILARHVINSFGGSISDESGEKVVFNSPDTVEAIKWLVDTYTNPKYAKMLPDGIFGWSGSSNNENFLGGKIVFTQNASSLYWAAKNQKNEYFDKMQLVAFPKGPKFELMGGYPYYCMVFKKAKNRDAAIELAKFQAQDKQVFDRVKIAEGQSWPVYQKQVDAPDNQNFAKSDPNYAALLANCTHPSGWAIGWPSGPNAAISAVHTQNLPDKCMEDAVNKKDTPENLVKQYHQRMVEIFNSFGFKQ